MGVNNEYSYDAFQGEDAYDDDQYEDEHEVVLDHESWQDWHSEHMLNMWMSLRQYLEDNGLTSTMMKHATFPAFVEFVQAHSQ